MTTAASHAAATSRGSRIIDAGDFVGRRRLASFVMRVHRGNPCFKDLQIHKLRSFLNGGDSFIRECAIRPVIALDGAEIAAGCLYISHPGLAVLQVGFLESIPGGRAAVEALISEAREEARRRGLERVVVGLQGHPSYGVGLLSAGHELPIAFDGIYTAPWTVAALDGLGLESHGLTSWRMPLAAMRFSPAALTRCAREVVVRTWDLRRFDAEARLFGQLANDCLAGTPYYFPKPPEAMTEILGRIRPLLRPEHLLFAEKGGRTVGFYFWLPDFNEALPGGRRTSLIEVGLRGMLLGRRIQTIVLDAVGVLPEHRRSTILTGLLYGIHSRTVGRYASCETTFVWDDNRASTLVCRAAGGAPHRRWRVYELAA
jgi:hypothetical protein